MAVLEKNKEIEEKLRVQKENYGTPNSTMGTYNKIEQARAFRELVEAVKEVKK